MWKLIKQWRTDSEFVKWAKTLEKKTKDGIKEQFKEAWPKVRNNSESVRASFVLYWELRTGLGTIHHIAEPMAIAYLAYLGDGAQAVGREDLIPVINNMVLNIPRLNVEIKQSIMDMGESNEEE
jgi:hypothetical protein